MKIIKLTFKNINSLAGTWTIDFNSSEYLNEGLFAITGPTGAGKSTILDAVCLALYGQTPRQSDINKNNNQVITRKTNDCFSELIFECESKYYMCKWSQERTRPKKKSASQIEENADYEQNLKQQSHEISINTKSNSYEEKSEYILLANTVKEVPAIVEEITGMSFANFTRSAMLAQGSFTSFLNSKEPEKAALLEQILGGYEYSEISKYIYNRSNKENIYLNNIETELSNYQCLSDEEQKELSENINENNLFAAKLEENIKINADQINQLKNVDKIENQLSKLKEKQSKLNKEYQDFIPRKNELEKANKASEIEHYSKDYHRLDQENIDLNLLIKENLSNKVKAEKQKNEYENKLVEADKNLKNCKKAYEDEKEILKEVRALDIKINNIEEKAKEADSRCNKAKIDLAKTEENIGKAVKEKEKNEKDFSKKINKVLAETNGSDDFDSILNKLEVKYSNLKKDKEKENEVVKTVRTYDNEIQKFKEKIIENEEQFTKLNNDCNEQKDELSELQKSKENKLKSFNSERIKVLPKSNGEEQIDFLIDICENEKNHLLNEQKLAERVKSLEQHRAELKDGEACPLCGSLEHPYAEHSPVFDDSELRIKQLEKFIKKAQNTDKDLQTIDVKINSISDSIQKINKNISDLQKTIDEERERLKTVKAKRNELYGEKDPDNEEKKLDSLLSEVEKELKKNQKLKDDYNSLLQNRNEKIISLDSDISNLTKMTDFNRKTFEEEKLKFNDINSKLNHEKTKRSEMYGDKDPDSEENKLIKAVDKAEKNYKDTQKELEIIKNRLSSLTSLEKEYAKKSVSLNDNLIEAEKTFKEKLNDYGFTSAFDFESSLMDKKSRDKLAEKAKSLEIDLAKNEESISITEKNLKESREKLTTDKKLSDLIDEQKQLTEKKNDIMEAIGSWKEKLSNNLKQLEKYNDCKKRYKDQKIVYTRWENLNKLVGSSKGDKFRTFAQGIMFETVVASANNYLKKISKRYELVRDEISPLTLNVKDYDQMGIIRPVKNLSGGETFIVCLSLALGLSVVASYKVAVNSLFLDEGFGSLDDLSLEKALYALASLNAEGKTIGIISHVPLVKERIGLQIEVSPLGNGHSQISGPGVKAI